MSFGVKILVGIVVVGGLVVLGYRVAYPTYSWNQKLTVAVEVDGKTLSGSSVTGIKWWRNFFSGGWGGAAWHSRVQGEAVVVDLGDGRYLFALLSYSGNPEYIEHLATRSLYNETKRVWGREQFRRVLNTKEPIIVPRKVYPMLVTFADINDPKTVKRVDPGNLAASFGAGYTLKSITLEITSEPVTKGEVERVLGWFYNVDRIVPKENLQQHPRGEPIPGKGNFINWRSWRKK